MNKLILTLFFFLSILPKPAASLEIAGTKGTLAIDLVQGFNFHENFLGLPFVMIQRGEGKKSSISFVPTAIARVSLEDALLRDNYDQYKRGRTAWADKRGHKNLAFFPFSSFNNQSRAKIIAAGYRYRKSDGTKNLERSFYVLCPEEMFQVKILTQNNTKGESFSQQLEENLKKSTCQT